MKQSFHHISGELEYTFAYPYFPFLGLFCGPSGVFGGGFLLWSYFSLTFFFFSICQTDCDFLASNLVLEGLEDSRLF